MTHYDDIIVPTYFNVSPGIGEEKLFRKIVTTSGRKYTAPLMVHPLRRFELAYTARNLTQAKEIKDLFKNVGGGDTFRIRDPEDYSSNGSIGVPTNNDQSIGPGDGATTQFQITKAFPYGSGTYSRNITHIRSGSLLVAVNGVAQTGGGVNYSVNIITGIITFTVAPGDGLSITCGYYYDIRVMFEEGTILTEYRGDSAANRVDMEMNLEEVPL